MKKIFFILFLIIIMMLVSCSKQQLPPIEITKEDYSPVSKILKVGESIDIYLCFKKPDVFNCDGYFKILQNDENSQQFNFSDFEITKKKYGFFFINDNQLHYSFNENNNMYEIQFSLKSKKKGNYKFLLSIYERTDNIGACFYEPSSTKYEKELEFIVTE